MNGFGVVRIVSETSGAKGGRPGKHYMLNEVRAQRDGL